MPRRDSLLILSIQSEICSSYHFIELIVEEEEKSTCSRWQSLVGILTRVCRSTISCSSSVVDLSPSFDLERDSSLQNEINLEEKIFLGQDNSTDAFCSTNGYVNIKINKERFSLSNRSISSEMWISSSVSSIRGLTISSDDLQNYRRTEERASRSLVINTFCSTTDLSQLEDQEEVRILLRGSFYVNKVQSGLPRTTIEKSTTMKPIWSITSPLQIVPEVLFEKKNRFDSLNFPSLCRPKFRFFA